LKLLRRLTVATFFVYALAATPASAQSATYQYDALGRLTFVQFSSGASVTYTYDATGNRIVVTATPAAAIVLPLISGLVIPLVLLDED
jgi:YD repeat-containing protein